MVAEQTTPGRAEESERCTKSQARVLISGEFSAARGIDIWKFLLRDIYSSTD